MATRSAVIKKILFIPHPNQEIMCDAYLHGLRSLLGADCVDYPKKEIMYKGFAARKPSECYGNLFTMWRTLDDIAIDRSVIDERLRRGLFDLVIFGTVQSRMVEAMFDAWRPFLDPKRTVVLDGADDCYLRPAASHCWYLKRELYADQNRRQSGAWFGGKLGKNILPASFSFPEEKICELEHLPVKNSVLPTHIVDQEVRDHARTKALQPQITAGYAFVDENDYYQNLRQARFGITTKKGGWDCLRHYEIAANAAVPCFRDLGRKPALCAPHGLDTENCLIYRDAHDLFAQLDALSDTNYDNLQRNALAWVRRHSTRVKARELLDIVGLAPQ